MEFLPAPLAPPRPVGELHIWSIGLSRELPQRRRAAANAALRQVLAAYLETAPERLELAVGPHGKPYLAAPAAALEFNLSHSEEIALVTVGASGPVGVDVERVRAERDAVALAERALSPEDVSAVRKAPPERRDLLFHRLWTRHEARLKCLGVGIFREALPETGAVAVQDLVVAPGYAAAVAIEAAALPPLRLWTFDPGALQKDRNRVS